MSGMSVVTKLGGAGLVGLAAVAVGAELPRLAGRGTGSEVVSGGELLLGAGGAIGALLCPPLAAGLFPLGMGLAIGGLLAMRNNDARRGADIARPHGGTQLVPVPAHPFDPSTIIGAAAAGRQ